jgi:spore germination protein GerM
MKRNTPVAAIVILLALSAGFGAYLVSSRQYRASQVALSTVTTGPHVGKSSTQTSAQVKIYHVVAQNNDETLEPVTVDIKPGNGIEEAALLCMIKQKGTAHTANPIPEGTRLIGLTIRKHLATVNLSREFSANFSGGSDAESMTIGAILHTLGQFPRIKRVRLLVEGKPIASLGHLDLSGTLDVSGPGSVSGGEN